MITSVEDASLGMDEDADTLISQWVVTDTLNRLRPVVSPQRGKGRGRRFGGNYLYLTYNSQKAQPALLNIKRNSFFSMVSLIPVILVARVGDIFLSRLKRD